jgi:hypothetical protein
VEVIGEYVALSDVTGYETETSVTVQISAEFTIRVIGSAGGVVARCSLSIEGPDDETTLVGPEAVDTGPREMWFANVESRTGDRIQYLAPNGQVSVVDGDVVIDGIEPGPDEMKVFVIAGKCSSFSLCVVEPDGGVVFAHGEIEFVPDSFTMELGVVSGFANIPEQRTFVFPIAEEEGELSITSEGANVRVDGVLSLADVAHVNVSVLSSEPVNDGFEIIARTSTKTVIGRGAIAIAATEPTIPVDCLKSAPLPPVVIDMPLEDDAMLGAPMPHYAAVAPPEKTTSARGNDEGDVEPAQPAPPAPPPLVLPRSLKRANTLAVFPAGDPGDATGSDFVIRANMLERSEQTLRVMFPFDASGGIRGSVRDETGALSIRSVRCVGQRAEVLLSVYGTKPGKWRFFLTLATDQRIIDRKGILIVEGVEWHPLKLKAMVGGTTAATVPIPSRLLFDEDRAMRAKLNPEIPCLSLTHSHGVIKAGATQLPLKIVYSPTDSDAIRSSLVLNVEGLDEVAIEIECGILGVREMYQLVKGRFSATWSKRSEGGG